MVGQNKRALGLPNYCDDFYKAKMYVEKGGVLEADVEELIQEFCE